jgi:hypothetical protein
LQIATSDPREAQIVLELRDSCVELLLRCPHSVSRSSILKRFSSSAPIRFSAASSSFETFASACFQRSSTTSRNNLTYGLLRLKRRKKAQKVRFENLAAHLHVCAAFPPTGVVRVSTGVPARRLRSREQPTAAATQHRPFQRETRVAQRRMLFRFLRERVFRIFLQANEEIQLFKERGRAHSLRWPPSEFPKKPAAVPRVEEGLPARRDRSRSKDSTRPEVAANTARASSTSGADRSSSSRRQRLAVRRRAGFTLTVTLASADPHAFVTRTQ